MQRRCTQHRINSVNAELRDPFRCREIGFDPAAVADLVPGATLLELEGRDHGVPDDVVAPVIAQVLQQVVDG